MTSVLSIICGGIDHVSSHHEVWMEAAHGWLVGRPFPGQAMQVKPPVWPIATNSSNTFLSF